MGDVALLDRIAAGDRAAFDELYARHAPWLHLRLSRRCADGALVEEALQDTFLVVWRKPRAYAGPGAAGAALAGCAAIAAPLAVPDGWWPDLASGGGPVAAVAVAVAAAALLRAATAEPPAR